MKFPAAVSVLLLSVLPNGHAWATSDVRCPKHPASEWRPHTELQVKLTSEGWVVRRMERTDTCYEVYAKDPNGKRIEAHFDPKTFERVEGD